MTKKKFPLFSKLVFLLCFFIVKQGHALESSVQLHKVNQEKAYGFSLSIGDEFFNQKAFNWQVSYNHFDNVMIRDLEDISEEWDKANYDFTIQTIDMSLTYRHYFRSYNKMISSLMFEAQIGASVNLGEHKLVFRPDFERDDIYFAKQGDINPVLSISLQKSLTKKSAIHFGFKHYPDYSDFGTISSLFIGYNYRFGRQVGY